MGAPTPGPGRYDGVTRSCVPSQQARDFHALSTEGNGGVVSMGPPLSLTCAPGGQSVDGWSNDRRLTVQIRLSATVSLKTIL
jgi:hypothetical protein